MPSIIPPSFIKTLHKSAYYAVVQQYGTKADEIKVGKKYKLLEMDGVNTVLLGKCLENKFYSGYYQNDFTHRRSLAFEFNNDHPLLEKELFHNVFKKINVMEYDKEDCEEDFKK